MRALVLTALDGPDALRWSEVAAPVSSTRVVIDVRAAGISYPDLLLTQGRYQLKAEAPFVPGSEVAGVVVSAPAGSPWRPGDRVCAATPFGGYAESAVADPAWVWPLPPELSFVEGAALPTNYYTAHFALVRRGRIEVGETVLVLGAAGGVGTAAIQVARALGHRVIAVVHRDGADDFLRGIGADDVVRLRTGWAAKVKELTGGRGVDLVVDPVGGAAFDEAVRVLAPEGRLVVLGFAGGAIPTVKVNRLLFRNVSVVGAGWGELVRADPDALRAVAGAVADLVRAGLRPPPPIIVPMAAGADALRKLGAGEILGKAVLVREGA
ncbi:NADPH:quinone oxidoreductase family protein [Cryptosporangium aurantiacum]|uniref:NADPH2:quinone reductase n=1 Tax=Cryptosporangium aurantiacum TaxID=134849 RepID=A0A1M7PHU2_9ACTN|nr:NADPH:quinone oxidoreductase family protein [Cryptosporangium aurantiacum]SHN16610.1 NADPH2:quinone reductase [Cryptosporangium aurantiacum]